MWIQIFPSYRTIILSFSTYLPLVLFTRRSPASGSESWSPCEAEPRLHWGTPSPTRARHLRAQPCGSPATTRRWSSAMLPETWADLFTLTPFISVHDDSLTPGSITQPGPTTTSGPIKHSSPTFALPTENAVSRSPGRVWGLWGNPWAVPRPSRIRHEPWRTDLPRSNGWKDLPFQQPQPRQNTTENVGARQVDASIDSVADEHRWLLDELLDLPRFLIQEHHPVLRWFGNLAM